MPHHAHAGLTYGFETSQRTREDVERGGGRMLRSWGSPVSGGALTLVSGISVTPATKEPEPNVDLLLGVALAASVSELEGGRRQSGYLDSSRMCWGLASCQPLGVFLAPRLEMVLMSGGRILKHRALALVPNIFFSLQCWKIDARTHIS